MIISADISLIKQLEMPISGWYHNDMQPINTQLEMPISGWYHTDDYISRHFPDNAQYEATHRADITPTCNR